MRKLTEEDRKMYDRATEFAPNRQILMMVWWDLFYPKKMNKLHKCITSGMTWYAAYTIAKNM